MQHVRNSSDLSTGQLKRKLSHLGETERENRDIDVGSGASLHMMRKSHQRFGRFSRKDAVGRFTSSAISGIIMRGNELLCVEKDESPSLIYDRKW